jgi:hypothetical protein
MKPNAADIPGRQRLKISDIPWVNTVIIAGRVLANVYDSVIGVGVKYDMMQGELGCWSQAVAIQDTTSFEVAPCGMFHVRHMENA